MTADVFEKLSELELRLAKIEEMLHIQAAVAQSPWKRPAAVDLEAEEPAVIKKEQPDSSALLPSAQGLYAKAQGKLLGIVAVLCFVLAAGFIVKLSIESGWLTPERQIGAALLFGLGLIGAGFVMMQSDREYASLLPAAGVITLYLTAFAAHSYYPLVSFEAALACVGLISALSIWLYASIHHDIYAIMAAVGAYLSPVMLNLHVNSEFALYYFLLCSCAFAIISVWLESRLLTILGAYLAIILSGLIGLSLQQDALIAVMVALHFLIFLMGSFFYTAHHGTALTEEESWGFLPVLLIFYAVEYHFIESAYPGWGPWISIAAAAILFGLYSMVKHYFQEELDSRGPLVIFLTLVGLHSVYLELLPDMLHPWILVAALVYCLCSPSMSAFESENRIMRLPFWVLLLVLANEYFQLLAALSYSASIAPNMLLAGFATFVALWAVLIRTQGSFETHRHYGSSLLLAAHLLAVSGLYHVTSGIGSLAVSASWLFYALLVMCVAFRRQDQTMATSALMVLAFAAGKAMLYDAASAPTLVRIGCLLLTGGVLYGCGFLLRKIREI